MLSVRSLFVAVCITLAIVSVSGFKPVNSTVWGDCILYSAHAGTAVSFNGALTTVGTGDVGVAPGSSISGSFHLGAGALHLNDDSAINCAASKIGAFGFLHGLTCPAANKLASPDLAGVTLGPGVWCSETLLISASTVTLDGRNNTDAVWVFQTATTLTTATATSFILMNGAQAGNVYWAIGSSATLATDSSFTGQIIAGVSITVNGGAKVTGRLIAAAAVSFEGNGALSLPLPCSSAEPIAPTFPPLGTTEEGPSAHGRRRL